MKNKKKTLPIVISILIVILMSIFIPRKIEGRTSEARTSSIESFGVFNPSVSISYEQILLGDIDGDGDLDIVCIIRGTNFTSKIGKLYIIENKIPQKTNH